jgi:uncharacterized protein (TIGR02145 family)
MYAVDLRENTGYGDMYSFELVNQHKAQLCPAPWSVPTKDDFVELDKALGGTGENGQTNSTLFNAYRDTWGAELSGICVGSSGNIAANGLTGYYWTQTAIDGDFGYIISINSGIINPKAETINKGNGFTVRCLKPASR